MAKDILSVLKEFALTRIKHLDIFKKEISLIEPQSDGFIVHGTFGKKRYYIMRTLDFEKIRNMPQEEAATVVVPNTKENFQSLLEGWQELLKRSSLCIWFVNPYSLLEKIWIVCPSVHASIADHASLKKGLMSMAATVELFEEITPEQAGNLVRNVGL
ncbi:MAG: hypothetical protein QXU88_01330 [Candidatus Woesearchaeota archaeon]